MDEMLAEHRRVVERVDVFVRRPRVYNFCRRKCRHAMNEARPNFLIEILVINSHIFVIGIFVFVLKLRYVNWKNAFSLFCAHFRRHTPANKRKAHLVWPTKDAARIAERRHMNGWRVGRVNDEIRSLALLNWHWNAEETLKKARAR